MNKLIILCLLFLTAATAYAEQSFQVKFYRKNGLEPLKYNIYDINKIDIKDVSDKNIMKIYYQDTNSAFYPVISIDSVKFETNSNLVENFTPYIFGNPATFPIAEIDSIIFDEIETIINEDVVVVDSTQSEKILSLDSAGLVLDKTSPLVKTLKTGDIFTGEPSDNAPNGFLRKIKSIRTEGDSVIIETEDAKITDVIESGVITFDIEFTPDDTLKKQYRKRENKTLASEGFTLGFSNFVIYDDDENENTKYDQIKIDGSINVTPKLGFNLVIDDWKVKQMLIQLSVKSSLEFAVSSVLEKDTTLQSSLNKLLGIPIIKLPSIVIPVGVCPACVPVTITSNIDFPIGVNFKVGAKVGFGVNYETSTVTGMEYKSGTWKKISSRQHNFEISPIELSVGGSVKAFVGPQLNMSFFGLQDAFNAYVNVFNFEELEINLVKSPLWKVSAGMDAHAGVKSKMFPDLDKELPFILEYRTIVAQSTDLIDSLSKNEAKVGDTITIYGKSFGNTIGSSYVSFKFGSSLQPADAIRITEYLSWSNEQIKVVVPQELNYGKIQILVNVGGYFSNKIDFEISDGIEKVKIGNQIWMKKNLDVTSFRNGDVIPQITNANAWSTTKSPAWCYYNNDPNNNEVYGKLYNWYAVNDPRGLAPEGYRIPTAETFEVLKTYLGNEGDKGFEGDKLKEIGTAHWAKPNDLASNSSGFTALPAGGRGYFGAFSGLTVSARFWTTSGQSQDFAYFWYLSNSSSSFQKSYDNLMVGYSVRCIKD